MSNQETISSAISDKRRIIEITAVTVTGFGKFIFMDMLEWRLTYILVAICGWTIYIILRHKKLPGILEHWGFRMDNFNGVTKKVLPFGLLSIVAFFAIGFIQGTIMFAIVHYPFYWLVLATFILAIFYGYIYLRARNVYVMGIFHGWLGGFFFYTVVNRDPFQEVFGKLINL